MSGHTHYFVHVSFRGRIVCRCACSLTLTPQQIREWAA